MTNQFSGRPSTLEQQLCRQARFCCAHGICAADVYCRGPAAQTHRLGWRLEAAGAIWIGTPDNVRNTNSTD